MPMYTCVHTSAYAQTSVKKTNALCAPSSYISTVHNCAPSSPYPPRAAPSRPRPPPRAARTRGSPGPSGTRGATPDAPHPRSSLVSVWGVKCARGRKSRRTRLILRCVLSLELVQGTFWHVLRASQMRRPSGARAKHEHIMSLPADSAMTCSEASPTQAKIDPKLSAEFLGHLNSDPGFLGRTRAFHFDLTLQTGSNIQNMQDGGALERKRLPPTTHATTCRSSWEGHKTMPNNLDR